MSDTGTEITNTTGLSRELLKLADDNKKLRERVIEAENSAYASKSEYGVLASNLRAELSQLRADLQAAQERCAEQAAQLEQARRVIMAWYIVDRNECGYDIFPDMKELDEVDLYESGDPLLPWALGLRTSWLAANAPQPAPQERGE